MMVLLFQWAVVWVVAAAAAPATEWVRGGPDGRQPAWGVRGGLQFAIPPASKGPRGLVRVLSPTLPGGQYDLINFIAVEPIVKGQRGFSELEHSRLDRLAGKRFWVEPDEMAGEITPIDGGVERLKVVVRVERFDNGASVRLVIEQRSDRPDEIALMLQPELDSAAIEYGILTATMGNKARTRLLWLKDEIVSSQTLYPDYKGLHFAPHSIYPLRSLASGEGGDLLVAVTTDEQRPADTRPFPGSDRWYYGGAPVTQYWRMPRGTWREDVHAALNARYTYWMSWRPIPGGIAFENFELRERFRPDQRFVFGITRKTPAELGVRPSATMPSSESAPAGRGALSG
ncbi:MAG TPA: hypothetical protein PKY77_10255 [Phycisphaerae bacterium]|nr:hypothetical protein [Phycisphaerae bacterium]HRY69960.1 hypothetical protein [Phycisphaerae bacterium]HSA27169.1 hypothetical protein [Phycisphaerae bacterium]